MATFNCTHDEKTARATVQANNNPPNPGETKEHPVRSYRITGELAKRRLCPLLEKLPVSW